MKTLKDFNLTKNPFEDMTPVIPPAHGSIFWAGMIDMKSKLDRLINAQIISDSRQVILNWGPWGGGKTHSAHYFISNYSGKIKNVSVTQILIKAPKNGSKAVSEFFTSVIDYLSLEDIRKQIRKLIGLMGDDEFINFLNERMRSRELVEAIYLLSNDDDEIKSLMSTYIYVGVNKTELKKLGLSRTINSDSETMKFLSGILWCFIGDKKTFDGRIILWIDEMEDFIQFSKRQYTNFAQELRNLVDYLSQRFTMFMNFTLSENQERIIEVILGGALWSRINIKIRFKELDVDDALTYCKDLIHKFQISKGNNNYFPFDEQALKQLLSTVNPSELTPREINKKCNSVLMFALENDKLNIDTNLIQEWMNNKVDSD